MANSKIYINHEMEGILATHCANNDIEITLGNAYDVFMDAFKSNPIFIEEYNENTGVKDKIDVTGRTAQYFEHQEKTILRVNEKIQNTKKRLEESKFKNNIKTSEVNSVPNLIALIENLLKLNIVDGDSYLAFVCFLMQLKYTRNHELQENDKTCVFFNGVARNGKSSTAKAIVDMESNYGKVYRATTGKVLESTHEEEVWKSHLNYFDEVKPTDIDRELLLTIINGGDVELNPKNKKHYTYHVNTNNIFTSNDQINLKQRRVSVVKFGKRLNGRPLGENSLKDIISNIMDALPSFEHYYDIYKKVSLINENRTNPLAIEGILTYLNKIFCVSSSDGITSDKWEETKQFSATNIYDCIKSSFNKQIIPTERKEAIREILKDWENRKLITDASYNNCSTKFYNISFKNYQNISSEFAKLNTKDENITKISKIDLYTLFEEYYKKLPTETENEVINENQIIIDKINDNLINLKVAGKIDNLQKAFKLYEYTVRNIVKSRDYICKDFTVKHIIDKVLENTQIFDILPYDIMLSIFKDKISVFSFEDEKYLKEKYDSFLNKDTFKEENCNVSSPISEKIDNKEIILNNNQKEVLSSSDVEIPGNQIKAYYDLKTYIEELISDKNGVENVNIKKLIKEDTYIENICKKLYFESINNIFKKEFGKAFTETLQNMLKDKYDKITCKKTPTVSKKVINNLDNIFYPLPF